MSIFSANFELLCLSIQQGDASAALLRAEEILTTRKIGWDKLYEQADLNAVKPQLGRLLNKMPLHTVPDSILNKLELANRENLYLQLQNVSEYFQIKKQLDEAGIKAIPFKGFWLANAFYDNFADRESVDVDLFINVADLDQIKTIMNRRGYVPEEPLPELRDDYIINELCEYNFDQYNGETRIFHFEYHWRISLRVYGLNINLEELQSQITKGTFQHRELNVFTPSANLLLAVMHHGGKDQFLQLKQVSDIACMLLKQPDIDWRWLAGKAAKYQMENLLYVSIKLASMLTGIKIPTQIKDKVETKFILSLANNRVRMMDEKENREKSVKRTLNNFYFQLRSRNSATLRMRLIIYEIRTGILPQLVPRKFHRFFLNKKIRNKPINK